MIVCSLITISVVSGRGRLTLDAMAAASVSTMILIKKIGRLFSYEVNETVSDKFSPIVYRLV